MTYRPSAAMVVVQEAVQRAIVKSYKTSGSGQYVAAEPDTTSEPPPEAEPSPEEAPEPVPLPEATPEEGPKEVD